MGRKSLKPEQQQKIVEAFYEISIREGIENTSFGKVAKELDMHPSLVVHYMESKEEMLLALVDHIIASYQHIYQAEQSHAGPLDNLVEVLNNIFSRKWNSYIDDGVFYDCFALTFRHPLVKQKFRELNRLLREWLEKIIRESANQGLIECADPAATANLIFVVSDGAYYYLSLVENHAEYDAQLFQYKRQAFALLQLEHLIGDRVS